MEVLHPITIDNDQAQVHDLVRLGSQAVERLIREAMDAPESWVAESLNLAPWAVVRRAQPDNPNQVAIGIQGAERSQRWAAEAEIQDFTDIVTAKALSLKMLFEWWTCGPLEWQ